MPGMYDKTDVELRKARTAAAQTRKVTGKRRSEEFDWDRAIAGLQRIFAELDAEDRRLRRKRPR